MSYSQLYWYLCQSWLSSIIGNTFICCIYFLNEFTLRVSVTLRNSVRHVMLLCRQIMLFMFTRKTSIAATTIDALHKTVRLNAACWVCRQVLTSAKTIRFQNFFLRSNPQESFPERGSAILVFTRLFFRVTIRNLSVSWCPTQKRFIGLWRNIKIRLWLLPLRQIARDFLILVIISKLSAISYSKFSHCSSSNWIQSQHPYLMQR